MIRERQKFGPFFHLIVCGLLLCGAGIISVSSSAEAESNNEVRIAIDRVRATLVRTANELKASEKATSANLKSGVLKSLNQSLNALTQIDATLNTIQDRQERRIDPNHLYCIAIFSYVSNQIEYCFLANNPNVRFPKTFDALQQEGWHLTATAPTTGTYTAVVYSKYVE